MNRRQALRLSAMALAARRALPQAPKGQGPQQAEAPPGSPPTILLQDYRPVSLYKIQVSDIRKARYPVFDAHSHGSRNFDSVDEMVKVMDSLNIEKTVIMTGASIPERFAEVVRPYAKYRDRFDMWCLFDFEGVDQPGYGPAAVKSLEGCHQLGAKGVGEVNYKGGGFGATAGDGGRAGASAEDPRLDALWDRCGSLGMPINIHIGDPVWGYAAQDKTNEAGMFAWKWKVNLRPGMYNHLQLIDSLENAVKKHRRTTFIFCHLANLEYDLEHLGGMFDRNPNLFADISWKFVEIATIPRTMNKFLRKYPDRVLYGTDHDYARSFLRQVFRIIETSDEHFYLEYGTDCGRSSQACIPNPIYHWPLSGLDLPDDILKKLYHDNAVAVFRNAQRNAV
jgi:uncharacterized protein